MKITNDQVYVIAEIGVNHNGSVDVAKKLIEKASNAKVDAVKFQTFKASKLLSRKGIDKAPYQTRDESQDQFEMLQRLELNFEEFYTLKSYAEDHGLDFISTPYDNDSVVLLEKLNVEIYKIASADIVNRILIQRILETKKPIILATGMATLDEIKRTIDFIKAQNSKLDIYLLHCTTAYPTDYSEVNMNFIRTLKSTFKIPVGYSDHTIGNEISLMAVSMGACIIEKHFTLDHNMSGPDHFASVEPDELKTLVKSIRNIEKAFGPEEKAITKTEEINKTHMRRSIHLNENLEKGKKLEFNHLSFTRPYDGIEIWEYEKILGKTLKVNKQKGDPLFFQDLD
jgi:sialic acid synthase SpsE